MNDIKIQISNYKLIKKFEKTFENPTVLNVTGKNEIGKSSLIRGFIENITATSLTPNPVTHGELAGTKSFTFPDKNGNEITVVHEFSNTNKKGTFYCIDHEGNKIKEVKRIREAIGLFEEITVDTFYTLQQTSAGRRKIIENYLYPLLRPTERTEIETIDRETEKGGTLYDSRTLVNQELSFLSNMLSDLKVKEEDKVLALEYDNIVKEITDLEQKKLAQMEQAIQVQNVNQTIKRLDDTIIGYASLYKDLKQESDDYHNSKLREIEEYRAKIIQAEKDIETSKINYLTKLRKLQTEEEEHTTAIEKHREYVKTMPEIVDYDEKINELRTFRDLALSAKNKLDKYEDVKQKNRIATDKALTLDKDIAALRDKKKEILTKSNLPSGLSIEGDNFTWNGFAFTDTQISKSSALLVIAEILCNIVESKIVYFGEKALFDNDRYKKLIEIAQKYGKIPILEEVVNNQEEVKIIVELED